MTALFITQGTTLTHKFKHNGSFVSAILQARTSKTDSGKMLLNVSTETGGLTLNDGYIELRLTSSQTIALEPTKAIYELHATDSNNEISSIDEGYIKIKETAINRDDDPTENANGTATVLQDEQFRADNYENYIAYGFEEIEDTGNLSRNFSGARVLVQGRYVDIETVSRTFMANSTTEIWLDKDGVISFEESKEVDGGFNVLPVHQDKISLDRLVTDDTKVIAIRNVANRTKIQKRKVNYHRTGDELYDNYQITSGEYSGLLHGSVGGVVNHYFNSNALYFSPNTSDADKITYVKKILDLVIIERANDREYKIGMRCTAGGMVWKVISLAGDNMTASSSPFAVSGYAIDQVVVDGNVTWQAIYPHFNSQSSFWLDILPTLNTYRYPDSNDAYPNFIYVLDSVADISWVTDMSSLAPYSYENLLYNIVNDNILTQTSNNLTFTFQGNIHPANGGGYTRQYFMDNVEVHRVLKAMSSIYSRLGASYDGSRATIDAHKALIKTGVNSLRDSSTGLFGLYQGFDITDFLNNRRRGDVNMIRAQCYGTLFDDDAISKDHTRQAMEAIEEIYPNHYTDGSSDTWFSLLPTYSLLKGFGDKATAARVIEYVNQNIPKSRFTVQDTACYQAILAEL